MEIKQEEFDLLIYNFIENTIYKHYELTNLEHSMLIKYKDKVSQPVRQRIIDMIQTAPIHSSVIVSEFWSSILEEYLQW